MEIRGPRNFNFEKDDTPIVRCFKENKIYMWFREPLPEHSIFHELK